MKATSDGDMHTELKHDGDTMEANIVASGENTEIERKILLSRLDSAEQSSEEESDSEITKSLQRIGVTIPSFMMPKLEIPSASSMSKKINEYLAQSVSMDKSSSSHIKELLGDIFNKRTTELKNLYSEVSESFADIVNSNIDHPVDDYIDQLQDDSIENSFSTENNTGTITDDESKKAIIRKEIIKHDHLTNLTFEQFQDQEFLRRRIKQILSLEIDPLLQRLLIQKLMSRSYIEKQNHYNRQLKRGQANEVDDRAITTSERGETAGTTGNFLDEYSGDEEDYDDDDDVEEDEVFLNEEDKTPTYYSLEAGILGCRHYQRNCKVECPQCHGWYTCRFCHDETEHSHTLDREQIKHVLCMFCFTPQYPAQFCVECDRELSKHYCDKCKLFDNDPMKNIYHCDKCGICRLGLGLNQDYFHCDSCNACISIELMENHVCIENSTKSNCPICDEFMFSSHDKVVFMSCGHPIHEKCYFQHTLHSYKCPTCSKTITNMELQFRMRDAEIKQSMMPEEIRDWETEIKCNDCGGMSRVPFHYLGHECNFCHSYNTMQIKLIKGNGEDMNVTLLPPELSARKRAISLVTAATIKNSTRGKEEVDVAQDKLNSAEKFISDSLKQNFEFDQVKDRIEFGSHTDRETTEEDNSIDHDYVNNFIRVINNFETYSSISDAFKDWINASLDEHFAHDGDIKDNADINGHEEDTITNT